MTQGKLADKHDERPEGKSNTYILGRVRAMLKHSEAEIEAIAACMHDLRRKFAVNYQAAAQSWHIKPLFVGFHGFASNFQRSVFLRCIKFCIISRVIYSTFMSNGSFEGVLVIHPISEAAGVQDLDNFVELFKMSAGLTDLGTYTQRHTVAHNHTFSHTHELHTHACKLARTLT